MHTLRKAVLFAAIFLLTSIGMTAQISSSRARQIQVQLNKNGFKVPVTGRMDSATTKALRDFQKAHKWQSRIVPDARALQELGLGPRYPNILNLETAWLAKGSTWTVAKD